jgi:hypothetical protein
MRAGSSFGVMGRRRRKDREKHSRSETSNIISSIHPPSKLHDVLPFLARRCIFSITYMFVHIILLEKSIYFSDYDHDPIEVSTIKF